VNGDQPTEEQAQRQTPKVEPAAEDLPKEEPDAGPPAGENRSLTVAVRAGRHCGWTGRAIP